ncbi:prepilin-type N-terminal cleavage/methylation domain-containing protein [Candidatus Curtissbacteria bacterium]|nr:prepilin-type N-terminal cleavage/methylation domain-containing protein [Candidatus Curtissbacteria bacterium]
MPTFKLLHWYIATLLRAKKQFNNLTISADSSAVPDISEERLWHLPRRPADIKQFNNSFTLIELLVVITLFALTAGIVAAAYNTFERNQRLKNAALALKTDIRFTQNKALSGDKSTVSNCGAQTTLVGWYLRVQDGGTAYTISSDCKDSLGSEVATAFRTVNLSSGLTINDIFYNGNPQSDVSVLFQTLTNAASFHYPAVPAFLNADGSLRNQFTGGNELTIELISGSSKYQVIIRTTGEVSEKKI